MQIGQVAARTELSIKTIRHYDEIGLVAPSARSAGGFRLYTDADVQRLLVIRRMKPLGFSLDEMRELLAALDTIADRGAASETTSAARDVLADFHRRAEESCVRLRAQLAYAEELTAILEAHAGGDTN
ncbi:MerR family transcriptional regulator [Rhodococcus chondri]|uniref:MerR family transcriptional regulator n=1 Tax=Rhodococcus chondri TaxID=3065941 RepID=A0ABU7JTB8_9NOCA|nr:MerR family transcriptional regulator [Rhodococcus sp. CC-R104]MEE2033266.1 MerR family transcriptional regulator [Rhodococcus sp. CC-R104]